MNKLIAMAVLTAGLFVGMASAAAHTGGISASENCESYTVTATLDSNVSADRTYTVSIGGTVVDSGNLAGPQTLTYTGPAPVTGNAVLTIGTENTYTAPLVPAQDCQTITTTTTVPTYTTTTPTTTTTTTTPTTTTTTSTTTTTTPTTTTTTPGGGGGGGGGGTTTVPTTTTTTLPTVAPTTIHNTSTSTPDKVLPTTVRPGGTAFTGVENVVPIGAFALMLMTSGSGLLWAGARRRRQDGSEDDD
jgi:hypothetical protein